MNSLRDSKPKGWNEKKIKEFARTHSGGTPLRSNEEFYKGNIRWVKSSELKQKYLYDTEEYITELALKKSSARMADSNSILFAMYGATAGDMTILKKASSLNQAVLAISINEDEDIDLEYFYYFLKRLVYKLIFMSQGGGQPNLSKGIVDNLYLLYPKSKLEQIAIATILSKVDETIQATQTTIQAAEKLKKALMQNLLTGKLKPDGTWRTEKEFKESKLGLIPKNWEIKTIKDLSTQVTDGEHYTPDRSDSGYYLLSARNIKNSYLDLSKVDYVNGEVLQKIQRRCNPKEGDIFISCSGTIGNVCIVPKGLNAGMVRSAALVKLKKDKIEPEYAELVLQSFPLQNQMKVSVASSVQGNIFQGAIKKLKIAYPPSKKERDAIATKMTSISILIKQKQSKIKTLQRLKKSLMQNLLTGKIRVDVDKINEIISKTKNQKS